MSHAANLRIRQHASVLPQKRRKLSDNGARPTINGFPPLSNGNTARKLDAISAKDAKIPSSKRGLNGPVKISQVDGDTDMTERRNGAVESSDEESENEGEEGEEDEDDASDDDSSDDEQAESEDEESAQDFSGDEDGPVENQQHRKEALARSNQVDDKSPSDNEEPSFGDMLRSRGDEAVDVAAAMPDFDNVGAQPNTLTSRTSLPIPTANSLGTVLTQALRSNDTPLLESCLQVSQLTSIRATIERLPSFHAATLLQRLAERMHKRPGRAGSLMVWVQWTVVAHGGYLATQPAAMKQIKELYKVVKMRATGLQSLLALKGKLDMLEAQMQLRRNREKLEQSRPGDEEAVIYVEGEEESDSEAENDRDMVTSPRVVKENKKKPLGLPFPEESEDDEDMPNGFSDSDADDIGGDDEAEESDEEDEDLIDDEAEETDNDSDEEMSDDDIDFEDVDGAEGGDSEDDDEDEDEDEAPPPPKRAKGSRR